VDERRHPLWAIVLGWIGLVAHVATAFLYLAAGLMAPLYAIVLLCIVWLGLLALAVWLLRRHPVWTLGVPIASVLLFFGVMQLGGSLLGWSP